MPWKEMSVMDQKEEFILLWKSRKFSITELSQMFGISRPTAYKILNRYETYGIPGLKEYSRVPRHIANKTPERIEHEIVTLRKKHPRWGAAKLLVLLEDKYPKEELPKLSTVNLILKRNDLVALRKRRRKVEPVHPIFDPKRPNEVWSADFKGKFRMGNRKYCYPLTVADSYSRYVFAAKGMHAANAVNTKKVFTADLQELRSTGTNPYRQRGTVCQLSCIGKIVEAFCLVHGVGDPTGVLRSVASGAEWKA
jgi:transposase InsO family protein